MGTPLFSPAANRLVEWLRDFIKRLPEGLLLAIIARWIERFLS